MGDVLGRYRRVGLLGQGGMGEVYLGFDPVLERYVAIKQIGEAVLHHPENATLLSYFEREAKVVAALQHPNIIQIYEYGRPESGPASIVTEFVDGTTFEDLSEDLCGVPGPACMALLHPVAEALEYAHERGIVHRDLKPGNVMLSRHGRVFLMDFGLAKPLSSNGLKSMVIGSPAFMSPEQVECKATDARTDIFSFGLLAFALSTSQLYFSVEAPRAFVEILADDYPKPERLQIVDDPGLRSLIAMCVQKDPDDRPSSMRAVVEHLEASLAQHGVLSPGREVRRLAQGWLDLMPQQYTLGRLDKVSSDTTPGRQALPAELVTGDEPIFSSAMGASATRLPSGIPVDSLEPAAAAGAPDHSDLARIDSTSTRLEWEPPSPSRSSDVISAPAVPIVVVGPGANHVPAEVVPASSPSPPLPVGEVVGGVHERVTDPTPPIVAGPELNVVRDALAVAPEKDLARRLLLFVAVRGGETSFAEMGPALNRLAGGGQAAERLGAVLASLVDSELLTQAGDDGIRIVATTPLGAVIRGCAEGPDGAESAASTLADLLDEASEARESFDLQRAAEWLARATRLCAAAGMARRIELDLWLRRAEVLFELERYPDARDLFIEVYASSSGDAAWCRSALGLLELDLLEQRFDRVGRRLETVQARAGQVDSVWRQRLDALGGWLDFHEGRHSESVRRLELTSRRDPSVHGLLARSRLGAVLTVTGDWSAAATHLEAAIEGFAELGHIAAEAMAQVRLGVLRRVTGELSEAEDALMQARGSAKAVGARRVNAMAWAELAELARLEGRLDDADRMVHRALGLAEVTRLPQLVHSARLVQVRLACDRGELRSVQDLAEQGLAHVPDRQGRLNAELAFTRALVRRGERAQAFERMRSLQAELAFPAEAALFWHVVARLCRALGRDRGATVARERAEHALGALPESARTVILTDAERWGL